MTRYTPAFPLRDSRLRSSGRATPTAKGQRVRRSHLTSRLPVPQAARAGCRIDYARGRKHVAELCALLSVAQVRTPEFSI